MHLQGAERMYKDNSQLRIGDFVFPYGKLDPENDWVKLSDLVPREVAEERYAARFANNGHPAHPARMALGALLIQRRLKCGGQWLVKHVGENPYLQYFIGMKEYGPYPFGASTPVAFRKRFSEQDLAAINIYVHAIQSADAPAAGAIDDVLSPQAPRRPESCGILSIVKSQ